MSIYSTSLKQQVYEARQFNQTRCEFRLDRSATYYSNLRLVGVGASCSGSVDSYNRNAGAYSVIKRIVLLDGGMELERCDETNRYLAWKNQLSKNQANRYVNQRLAKHNLGFRLIDNGTNAVVDSGGSGGQTGSAGEVALRYSVPLNTTTGADLEKTTSWLDLRECLPLLNNLIALDTDLMPNLRIQIEWETNALKVLTNDTTKTITIQQPVLVADMVKDPALAQSLRSQMNSVVWKTYEHDQVIIPASARGADQNDNVGVLQNVNKTINGFDNKFLHRLMMSKTFSNKTLTTGINNGAGTAVAPNESMGYGDFRSQAQHNEKVQFVVNGGNIFTGEGLTSSSQKADIHAECWGELNVVPFAHLQRVGLDTNLSASQNNEGVALHQSVAGSSTLVGQADYVGVRVEERVRQLDLNYSRNCLADVMTNKLESEELEVHFFGEVSKSLVLDGRGSYTISYL